MKKISIIALAIAGLAGLFSCPGGLLTMSISQRISAFEDALNDEDRSNLYTHFHPEETANYNQIKDAAFWDGSSLSYENAPFAISVSSESTGTGGREIREGSLSLQDGLIELDIRIILLQDGQDWYIEEFILLNDNGGELWSVKQLLPDIR